MKKQNMLKKVGENKRQDNSEEEQEDGEGEGRYSTLGLTYEFTKATEFATEVHKTLLLKHIVQFR